MAGITGQQSSAMPTASSWRSMLMTLVTKPAQWWIAKGAKRLRPAGAKDPGDMFKAGGSDSVLTWVKSALA